MAVGHVGADRLWYHMEPKFEFPFEDVAKAYTQVVGQQCETCQAAQRSHRLAGPQEPIPVPPRPMVHVAIDIFAMPEVMDEISKEKFDRLVVCVDRHSGWIIAVPCLDKGLTGRSVALKMLNEWRIFGVPSIITSDQGSHFTSVWWKKHVCS